MNKEKNSQGYSVKGREQIIRMLRVMTKDERQLIINRLRLKNPILADELTFESFSFDQIAELSTQEIIFIGQHINNNIWVLALKHSDRPIQQKILRSLERSKAEEIFQKLQSNFLPTLHESTKAQDRIIDLAINILKRRKTNLQ